MDCLVRLQQPFPCYLTESRLKSYNYTGAQEQGVHYFSLREQVISRCAQGGEETPIFSQLTFSSNPTGMNFPLDLALGNEGLKYMNLLLLFRPHSGIQT